MKSKILKLAYENPKTHIKTTGRIELKSQTPGSAELYIYGDICSSSWDAWQQEDVCPQDVADFLAGLTGMQRIAIYINSGGGDSFAGLAIYNILARSGAHIDVYIDGIAASAAGLIAVVGCRDGNTLHMPPGAELMIHKCWTVAMGNADDFAGLATALTKCDQSYVEIFATMAQDGVTAEQFAQMQTDETWLNGAEVEAIFKNVQVDGAEIAASLDNGLMARYKNVPQSLIKSDNPGGEKPPHIHDGVVPPNISTDTAPESESWQAPNLSDFTDKQWGDLTEQEQRDIAGHYAWSEEMPPDTFGALKFPHHDPETHKVVFAALPLIAGRIDTADIPEADKPAVRKHTEEHYHQFGKKAPWEQDDGEESRLRISKAKLALACEL